jgi:plastocyanin
MRNRIALAFAGACLVTAVIASPAHAVDVTLANLGVPGETGSGTAEVELGEGKVNVRLSGLRAVPHEDARGVRIRGYAVWLVNSEDALGKLNIGFVVPEGDGTARLRFRSPNRDANLASLGFNMVVLTDEAEIDTAISQPSAPPIAAGVIPGATAPSAPPPAVEVLMGKINDDVFGFQPATIVVLHGQRVRWTNVSGRLVTPHTATRVDTIDDCAPGQTPPCPPTVPGFNFESGAVAANGTFSHTFNLADGQNFALFNYHCTPHLPLGMTGRIFVRRPPPAP